MADFEGRCEDILTLAGEALGIDLSYLSPNSASLDQYETSLQRKVHELRSIFFPYWSCEPTIFRSPPVHYRLRAKFGIGRVLPQASHPAGPMAGITESARTGAPQGSPGKLCYLMWGADKKLVVISSFPLASRRINDLMPRLLLALGEGPLILRRSLRAVNFLDTLAGDTLIALIYETAWAEGGKAAKEEWVAAAREHVKEALGVQVVGRGKRVALPVDRAYVLEEFCLSPPPPASSRGASPLPPCAPGTGGADTGRDPRGGPRRASAGVPHPCPSILRYKQWDGAFSNPNGCMALHTLRWLCARADAVLQRGDAPRGVQATGGEADERGRERQMEDGDREQQGDTEGRGGPGGCEGCVDVASGGEGRVCRERQGLRPRVCRPPPSGDKPPAFDLLELFCGGGNHTVALSRKFRRVVGVEIDRRLVAAAKENLALNGVKNASVIQIPSERFHPERLGHYRRQQEQEEEHDGEGARARTMLGPGKRVASAGGEAGLTARAQGMGQSPPGEDDPSFRVVLVDPPRAGLDRHTRKMVSNYEDILYISCAPLSLLRDLRGESEEERRQSADRKFLSLAGFGLVHTHRVVDMCVLDHFPGTRHIEVAVHLQRRGTDEKGADGSHTLIDG